MSLADDFASDAGLAKGAALTAAPTSVADQFAQDAGAAAPVAASVPAAALTPRAERAIREMSVPIIGPSLAALDIDPAKYMPGAFAGSASGAAQIGNTMIHGMTNGFTVPNNFLTDGNPAQAPQQTLSGLVTGQAPQNDLMRANAARDASLKSFDVANQNQPGFTTGKIATQAAMTYPLGGAIAAPLKAAIPALAPLADAVATGGMRAGGISGLAGTGVRMLGGAINGGASAALVNPDDAGMGALIGGATPVAVQAAGRVGGAIGDYFAQGQAAQAAALARRQPTFDTLRAGIDAGYVVPPSSVDPTLWNQIKESTAGKIATAQSASTQNQVVTDRLVRSALGLPEDAPLSAEAMQSYRAAQHQAGYVPLRNLGPIPAGPDFNASLDNILRNNTGNGTIPAIANNDVANLVNAHRSTGFDSADAVDAIRVLRENANDAFSTGNTAMGRTNRQLADAYEEALQTGVPSNQPDLLTGYQNARANIARSFTVEDALREGAGTVDARRLAAALQRGDPLDGDLLTAARFANTFPKAAQPPSAVNGPGVHNMKSMFATGAGGAGAYIGGTLGGPAGAGIGAAIGGGAAYVVPAALRAQMFSRGAQEALIPQLAGPGLLQNIGGLLANPGAQQTLLKTAPMGAGLLGSLL